MTTLRRQVKNMVKNYSEPEVKVREATSNDPWGPSSTLMSEISDLTYNIVALGEVMRMLWKRLNDHGKNWRHVYKSLVLLDYLIKNGNEKVAQQCKEHIVAIQTLKDFQYMDEQKDQGASVREKAKQLVNLLRDDERLKQERAKAFRARERYAQNAMGISSDNKITFGTTSAAAAGAYKMGASSRTSGNYADPYGGATASNLNPDLEAVRPSDPNEEDLQIKLAIMLSKQEHDDDESKVRADQAKLALALEESKTEGQPNGLVDLADFGNNNSNSGGGDPWTSSKPQTSGRYQSDSDSDQQDFFPSSNTNDPWSNSTTASNKNNNNTDPWGNDSNKLTNSVDPWANSTTSSSSPPKQKTDDFDMFSSNRTVVPQKPVVESDPFGDFFGNGSKSMNESAKSTNPWNGVSTSSMPVNNNISQTPSSSNNNNNISNVNKNKPTSKTPDSFLGENSSLVNLDNLIPTTATTNGIFSSSNNNNQRPKSTNPFGGSSGSSGISSTMTSNNSNPLSSMSSSTSTGHLAGINQSTPSPINNPFSVQQQKQPTISQLQQQQNGFSNNTNGQFQGQLAQPLIPPVVTAPGSFQMNGFPNQFNTGGAPPTQPPPASTNPFLMM